MKGTVKWFSRDNGYGFISGEDGKDYFVHHTALARGTFIRDDDLVSFDAVETERGIQAQNVTLLKKGSEIRAEEKAPKESEEAAEEPTEEEKEEPEEEKEAA